MHHEFGHEWWGNKVTAKDWSDMWIHEGICSFGDVLYLREMEGEDAYLKGFQIRALFFENKKPVVQGKDLDEEAAYISDIYGKGAFFMHTLRYVIGDSIFFPAIKQLVADSQFNFTTTDDVEQFFSKQSGKNLQPLFILFLKTTNKLEVSIRRVYDTTIDYRNKDVDNAYHISLTNIDMKLPLQISTSAGMQTIMVDTAGVNIKSKTLPLMDPKMYYLTKVIIE